MKINFIPLSREQFAQLREAKRIIKEEFNADLQLQDKNVLEQLYKYALESKNDRLFDIFNEIYQSHADNTDPQQGDQKVVQHPKSKKIAAQSADVENEVKVGDVVDGKKCTGFYRGQPVFKKI